MNVSSDDIDLGSLFRAVWRRKWIVLLCVPVGAGLAFAMTMRVTPLYTSQSSLMLDPRSVQVLSSAAVISDPDLNDGLMESAVAVLRSNVLLEEVIGSLDPEVLAPLDPANELPSSFGAFRARISDGLRGLFGHETPIRESTVSGPDPDEQRLFRLVDTIRRVSRVWRSGDSYVIAISVETPSPQISAEIANAIAQEFIDKSVSDRTKTARAATAWLGTRVDELRQHVEVAEKMVEQSRVSQLSEEGMSLEAISQQLLEMNTQLALAQADTATVVARFSQIERVILANGPDAAADLVSSAFVLALREELSQLQRSDADLASQYAPEYPERQRLFASIALVRRDLQNEVETIVANLRNDVAVAQAREAALRTSISDLEARHAEVSQTSISLRQLEREAESARTTYEDALARWNETRSIEEFQTPDARLVERAVVSSGPSAPRPKLFAAFGGVLGFTIGLVGVFLGTFLQRGVNSGREAERLTGIPVLSMLPTRKWRGRAEMLVMLQAEPYQAYAERIRQLRTILKNPRSGVAIRNIILTSALRGEGKTSTALAFAYSEAIAGKRTVLLDLDTRRSQVGRDLGLSPGPDLAALVRGRCSIAQAVRTLPHLKFDIITSLRPDTRLADEITADLLRDLLKVLDEMYDVVIIDSPPVLSVSESLTYCAEADAVIFLIRSKRTPVVAVRDALQRLNNMRVEPSGIVLTMTNRRDEEVEYATDLSYV